MELSFIPVFFCIILFFVFLEYKEKSAAEVNKLEAETEEIQARTAILEVEHERAELELHRDFPVHNTYPEEAE